MKEFLEHNAQARFFKNGERMLSDRKVERLLSFFMLTLQSAFPCLTGIPETQLRATLWNNLWHLDFDPWCWAPEIWADNITMQEGIWTRVYLKRLKETLHDGFILFIPELSPVMTQEKKGSTCYSGPWYSLHGKTEVSKCLWFGMFHYSKVHIRKGKKMVFMSIIFKHFLLLFCLPYSWRCLF